MDLSLCIITYNHEKFIRECLDGVLMQNINCEFEIVISDDCSNDNTLSICEAYKKRFPNLITILKNDRNIGMAGNWYKAIQSCKGNFIAICEGDDFWISSDKIQIQYDYMKSNDKCNICFHDVALSNSFKPYDFYFSYDVKSKFYFKDIILKHLIPTCSMMFRTSKIQKNIPKPFYTFPVCDVPVHLLLTLDGYAFHIKEQYAVYRINEFSITNNRNKNSDRYYKLIRMYFILLITFNFKYFPYFLYKIVRLGLGYFRELLSK